MQETQKLSVFPKVQCDLTVWSLTLSVCVGVTSFCTRSIRLIVLYHVSLARQNRFRSKSDRVWLWLQLHNVTSDRHLTFFSIAVTVVVLVILGAEYNVMQFAADNATGGCYVPPESLWTLWPSILFCVLGCCVAPFVLRFGIKTKDIYGSLSCQVKEIGDTDMADRSGSRVLDWHCRHVHRLGHLLGAHP